MFKISVIPAHPERTCWGCEDHCPVGAFICGNDRDRIPHPVELFGSAWLQFASEQRIDEAKIKRSLPLA